MHKHIFYSSAKNFIANRMANMDIYTIITHPVIALVIGIVTGIIMCISENRIGHYMNKRDIKKILKGELDNFIDNSKHTAIYEGEKRFNEIASQIKEAVGIDRTSRTDHDINTAYKIAVEIEEILKDRPTENDKILKYLDYATKTQEELTNQAEYCLKRLNQNILDRFSRTYPPRDRKSYQPPPRPPRPS